MAPPTPNARAYDSSAVVDRPSTRTLGEGDLVFRSFDQTAKLRIQSYAIALPRWGEVGPR